MQPRPANPSGRPILRSKNMRKPIISLIAAVSLGVALLFATTMAAPFAVKIRAEIPFDFMVGKKRLPKGEYLIESLNDSGTLTIRHAKKGKAVTFNTIRQKSTETILKLNKSKTEKRLAKLAKKEENPDEVPVGDK